MDEFGVLKDGGSCLVDVQLSLRSTFGLGRALVNAAKTALVIARSQ